MTASAPAAAPNPSLPGRVAWFAPWTWFTRWRPWKRWTASVGLLILGYLLSPAPVLWLVEWLGGVDSANVVLWTVYFPILAMCAIGMEVGLNLAEFYRLQYELLRSVIGHP